MRIKNSTLKMVIFEEGTTQRAVARETGIPETHISMAINGKYILDSAQRSRIARALGRKESELFGFQEESEKLRG
jgi:transcriptional regulator with XRE-family HTH domain